MTEPPRMRIQIFRNAFIEALERCAPATSSRSVSEYHRCVLIETRTDTARFYASSGFLSVDTTAAIRVKSPGSIAVDCADLLGRAQCMPDGLIDLQVTKALRIKLSSELSKLTYQIAARSAEEYPPAARPSDSAPRLAFDKAEFARCLEQVSFPLRMPGENSTDGVTRVHLLGSMILQEGDQLTCAGVAPNTARATAIVFGKNPAAQQSCAVFIPLTLNAPLLRALREHTEAQFSIVLDSRAVFAELSHVRLHAQLPQVLMAPATWEVPMKALDQPMACSVDGERLLQSVQAVCVGVSDRLAAVELRLSGCELCVRLAAPADAEPAEDRIDVEILTQDRFLMTVDPSILRPTLRAAGEGAIGIAHVEQWSAGVFRREGFMALLALMRNESPPEQEKA